MFLIIKILPIILNAINLNLAAHALYFACPPTSLCVPPSFCKSENITFDPFDKKFIAKYENKYVCGVFPECEETICCSDPVGLPITYQPNKADWCYRELTAESKLKNFSTPVHLYPGLEDHSFNEETKSLTICPPGSVCIRGKLCPQSSITFSFGFSSSKASTCGSHPETTGFVCCALIGAGNTAPVIEKSEKPKFMKENSIHQANKKKSWNFINSEFAVSVDKINVKEEKLFKEMTEKSIKNQEWVCGRTLSVSSKLQRIYAPIGNREAKEGDYPWHVAILSSTYEYLCSGVIVGEKLVTTIAHCFDKHNSTKNIFVRIGDLNLKENTEKNPAFDVRVKHVLIHPDYDSIKLEADIAVLEMEESVRDLPHIRPACLPGSGFSPAINKCKVPGWGQFSKSKEEKNEFNYALRAASFFQIDKAQCQNSLRKVKELGAFFKLQKNVLCAKGYSNADTCKGDGGSGLVCMDKDIYVLQGIVSYGFGCGFNLPGVYTDVYKYLDFIKNYKTYLPGGKNDHKRPSKASKITFSNNESYYKKPNEINYEFTKQDSVPIPFNSEDKGYSNIISPNKEYLQNIKDYSHIEASSQNYFSQQSNVESIEFAEENYIEPPVPLFIPNFNEYSSIQIPNKYDEEITSHFHVKKPSTEYSVNKYQSEPNSNSKTNYDEYVKIDSGNLPSIKYDQTPELEYFPHLNDYDIPPKPDHHLRINDYESSTKSYHLPHTNDVYPSTSKVEKLDKYYPPNKYNKPTISDYEITDQETYNNINIESERLDYFPEDYLIKDIPAYFDYKPSKTNYDGDSYKPSKPIYKEPDYILDGYIAQHDYKPRRYRYDETFIPNKAISSSNLYDSDNINDKFEYIDSDYAYSINQDYNEKGNYLPFEHGNPEKYYDDETDVHPYEKEIGNPPRNFHPVKVDRYETINKFDHDHAYDYNSYKKYDDDELYYKDTRNFRYGPSSNSDQRYKLPYITPKNIKLKSIKKIPSKISGTFSNVLNLYSDGMKEIDSSPELFRGKVKSPISLLNRKV